MITNIDGLVNDAVASHTYLINTLLLIKNLKYATYIYIYIYIYIINQVSNSKKQFLTRKLSY